MSLPAKTILHAAATAATRFAAIFAVLVGLLLALQAYRQRQASPLEAPELASMRQELIRNPDQAQAEKIRQLDYLYRRAWFSGEAQVRFGVMLLGAALLFFLVSLQLAEATAPRQAPKPAGKIADQAQGNRRIRLAILALGGGGALAIILWAWGGRHSGTNESHAFSGSQSSATPPQNAVRSTRPDAPIANDKEPPNAVRSTRPGAPIANDTEPQNAVRSTRPGAPIANDTEPQNAVRRTWGGFRGLNNLGIGDASLTPPDQWNGETGENIRWRQSTELPGFSSPVICGDRLFVTGGDKTTRAIFCHDAGTGQLLWRTDVPTEKSNLEPPQVTDDTGYAAATPATDGTHLCAIFATGELVGLDFSGQLLWSKTLGVPKNAYGHASSLLIAEGKLIVQLDDDERQSLAAYDPATGALIWESRRQAAVGWASPACIPTKTGPAIVVLTNETIEAFDLKSGKNRWTTRDCLRGEVAPSAAFADGRLFVANEYACAAALDPETGAVLWKNEEVDLPDVASPIAVGGSLYLFTSTSAQIVCLDAATGKKQWSAGVDEGFYSSPVLLGGQLLAFNRKGIVHRFKPNAEAFAETGGFPLGEPVMATPAALGRRLYVRSVRHLFCLEKGATAPAGPSSPGGQP